MILVCENCHTRYLVPSHAIGPEGRRVRCTGCGHEWHQAEEEKPQIGFAEALAQAEPIPESVKPVPEGLSVPLVVGGTAAGKAADARARMAGYVAAAAVVLLVLAATIPLRAGITSSWPPAARFYAIIGFDVPVKGEGLIFDHVQAANATDAKGGKIIKIDGRIINLKSAPATVPVILVSLKLPDGKLLDSWEVPHAPDVLGAQGETVFATSYPLPESEVKDVTVGFVSRRIP